MRIWPRNDDRTKKGIIGRLGGVFVACALSCVLLCVCFSGCRTEIDHTLRFVDPVTEQTPTNIYVEADHE